MMECHLVFRRKKTKTVFLCWSTNLVEIVSTFSFAGRPILAAIEYTKPRKTVKRLPRLIIIAA
jgi:hypothetical protein